MADGTPIDRDKLLSIGYLGRRTRDQVREWRTDDGERHKATTDENNNTVTQHAQPGHTEDRQDVQLRPQAVHVQMTRQQWEAAGGDR